jgi:hypothetical protein
MLSLRLPPGDEPLPSFRRYPMGNLSTSELYKIQYPSSTLTDGQIDSYIAMSSEAIEEYLRRSLGTTTHSEWHPTADDNVIILDEYPVTAIQGVAATFAEYARINITASDDVYSMDVSRDSSTSAPSITLRDNFGANSTTFLPTDYATVTLLLTALTDQLTTWGATVTGFVQSRYSGVNPLNIFDFKVQQGSQSALIEVVGIDMDSQVNWTLEAERELILSHRIPIGANKVMVQYTAGYILPVTTSTGTLPLTIVDACNRIVQDVSNQDAGSGVDLTYKQEKLGNASVTNWDYANAVDGTYLTGLVKRYSAQLDFYKKKDIGFC